MGERLNTEILTDVDTTFEAIVAANFKDGVSEIANTSISPAELAELDTTTLQKVGSADDTNHGRRWPG